VNLSVTRTLCAQRSRSDCYTRAAHVLQQELTHVAQPHGPGESPGEAEGKPRALPAAAASAGAQSML
jgi:hypothetical protein